MVPVLDPGRHGQGPVEGASEGQGSQEMLGLVTEAACERWGSGGDRAGDGSGTDRGMQREPHRGCGGAWTGECSGGRTADRAGGRHGGCTRVCSTRVCSGNRAGGRTGGCNREMHRGPAPGEPHPCRDSRAGTRPRPRRVPRRLPPLSPGGAGGGRGAPGPAVPPWLLVSGQSPAPPSRHAPRRAALAATTEA